MKGRITRARTAKPNSEKQVLQRVTQIRMMFSRDAVCMGGGAVHSALWTKPTPTLTARPAHSKHVPRVPCSPCLELPSLSAAVTGINKINTRSRGHTMFVIQWACGGWWGAGKGMMERERKETSNKACPVLCSHPSKAMSYSLSRGPPMEKANLCPSRTEGKSLTLDMPFSIAFSL